MTTPADRGASFFRTATFRLAVFYAGLFSVSVIVLLGVVYATTTTLFDGQQEKLILTDLNGLAEEFRNEGVDGLAEDLRTRVEPQRVGDGIYLLAGPDFRPLAGNVSTWPKEATRDGPWLVFSIGRRHFGDNEIHKARAIAVVLPGGFRLLVGQDTRTQEQFRGAILKSLLTSLALVLVLGIGGGLFFSRRLLARIEGFNRAAQHVKSGDVSHRMPVGSSGDEFDRLAENLNAMLAEIERLMGAIRSVTDNIAHDLRGPLTRLKNRLEAARAIEVGADLRKAAIEEAVAEADRLLATFNALLSIAALESDEGRREFVSLDLVGLAGDVAELYEPLAEEQGIAFETAAATPVTVSGDRHLLFQAVTNLVDNALKYTKSGGRVRLAVEAGGATGGARLSVADSGPGIPAADRERVLERFVRLDAARSTPGSGLGLSLVSAVARLHGARLDLSDNAPGLKATMVFPAG